MNILLFVLSYIGLNIVGSLLYVGLLLSFFIIASKVFQMDETKWSTLFNVRKGTGLLYIMLLPYILMLVILFPISVVWFKTVQFEYAFSGAFTVIVLLTATLLFKLPKIKRFLIHKYLESSRREASAE